MTTPPPITALDKIYEGIPKLVGSFYPRNLVAWLGIAVFFALAPLWIRFLQGAVDSNVPSLQQLCGRGEVLILAVALLADSMAKLIIRAKDGFGTFGVIFFVTCLMLSIATSIEFAFIQERVEAAHPYDVHMVVAYSVRILFISIIFGAILTERG